MSLKWGKATVPCQYFYPLYFISLITLKVEEYDLFLNSSFCRPLPFSCSLVTLSEIIQLSDLVTPKVALLISRNASTSENSLWNDLRCDVSAWYHLIIQSYVVRVVSKTGLGLFPQSVRLAHFHFAFTLNMSPPAHPQCYSIIHPR